MNEIFLKIKDAIVNERLIQLEIETTDNKFETIKVEPYKIYIREKGLYLIHYNIYKNKQDEVMLELIKGLNINL